MTVSMLLDKITRYAEPVHESQLQLSEGVRNWASGRKTGQGDIFTALLTQGCEQAINCETGAGLQRDLKE